MEVHRIAKANYARDLSGTGARLFGGRWNLKGTPMLYTSASRALAMLEVLVHANRELLPQDLELITLELPVSRPTHLDPRLIEKHWQSYPAPVTIQEWGSGWIQDRKELALWVPSVLVPEEGNVLINPLHPDMEKVKITGQRVVVWDGRFEEARKR